MLVCSNSLRILFTVKINQRVGSDPPMRIKNQKSAVGSAFMKGRILMDQNNDWYERYQTPMPQSGYNGPYRSRGSQHRGVRVSTLIICMLVTMLLGGALGGFFAKSYVDQSLSALNESNAGTLAASAGAQQQNPSIAVQNAPAVSSDTALQNAVTGTYTKAQVIELCAPTVVGIDTTYNVSGGYGFGFGSGSNVATGSGSGIILTSDGYIVTCAHVVEGASSVSVMLNDDTEHPATLVGTDTRNDLAVIKIEATGLTPATLGDSDMLTVGEDAVAIGNPLGELRGTATGGMISALGRDVTVGSMDMTLIQTDAAISPGNSGGGLFNGSGSLIGIVNAKASSSNSEGLGFAIPVNSVKQAIADLMDHGYVRGRAYLGVYTQNVTLSSGQNGWGNNSFFGFSFGNEGTACVQVAQLVKDGAAEKAGVQVGDLILKVDDKEITSNTTLSAAINAYNANDKATLTLQRNGEQLTVEVAFGEYTPQESAATEG